MPQSLSSLLVHLVFSTKGRHPWISPELEAELHPYLATVMQACESPAIIINGARIMCIFSSSSPAPSVCVTWSRR